MCLSWAPARLRGLTAWLTMTLLYPAVRERRAPGTRVWRASRLSYARLSRTARHEYMSLPQAWGSSAPYLASEGLLSRMLQGVHLERHAAFERFSTGFACKWHVFRVCCNTECTVLKIRPPKSPSRERLMSHCRGLMPSLLSTL